MSVIQIGGIVSGLDTEGMISGLVAAASQTQTVMEDQQGVLEDRRDAYETLSTRLSSLQTALQDMDTLAEFRSVTATSGDEDVVTVSVDGEAVTGAFSVQVNQLAASTLLVSSGFSSREDDGAFATGTLGITVGGTTTSVTIDSSSSSLDDVVDAINDQVSGVSAYVMETGDATNPYRLVIAGDDTGADNAVTLDTSGLTSGTVPTFTEATAAADAEVVINGITITHPDNDIDGAIGGVTIHANEVSTSAVTVNIGRDEDGMVEKVQAVADAWNAVMSHIRAQRSWDTEADIRGAFVGESEPSNVSRRLQAVLGSSFDVGGAFEGLSQIGLSIDQDGDLSLDEDALREALSEGFEDVATLLTDEDGPNAAFQAVIDSLVDEDDGILAARMESLDDQIATMTERIEDFEERMDLYEARLRKQFTAMELAMARFESASSALAALLPSSEDS